MSESPVSREGGRSRLRGAVEGLGRMADGQIRGAADRVSFVGGLTALLVTTLRWCYRGAVVPGIKFRRAALAAEMLRVGTKAVPIVALVQVFQCNCARSSLSSM